MRRGVCNLKGDNGCKHLRNGNEINAVSLPEYTCRFARRHIVGQDSRGKDVNKKKGKDKMFTAQNACKLNDRSNLDLLLKLYCRFHGFALFS